jgi:hypothetical protein
MTCAPVIDVSVSGRPGPIAAFVLKRARGDGDRPSTETNRGPDTPVPDDFKEYDGFFFVFRSRERPWWRLVVDEKEQIYGDDERVHRKPWP